MIKIDNKTISSIFSGEKTIEKIYKGTLKIYEGWRKLIASGVPPLTLLNCKGVDLIDYKIYGNAIQNGTPTSTAPVYFGCVGEYDETTDKYKIPVKVSNDTEEVTTNIYLKEPLRKIGDYADYIDFENKKVIRKIAKYEFKGTENLSLRVSQPTNGTAVLTTVMSAYKDNFENLICTRFSADRNYTSKMIPNTCCFINSSVDSRFHFCLEGAGKTVAEVKAILKEWYDSGNPIVVLYPPNKAIPEETIELPNIPTIKGTTIIEVDTEIQPSNMQVVYKGK